VGASLVELGLTFSQAHALRLLDPERPLPMSSLAERLFCDASNVTGIADRLEARGLVERRSAEGDRRVKALTLTPDGVELRDRVLEIMSEPPAAIAALSVGDQRALRDILRRAVEQLRM
jgi:MarR family transcriptional regulator, organic hydroperoxide resistance regulator